MCAFQPGNLTGWNSEGVNSRQVRRREAVGITSCRYKKRLVCISLFVCFSCVFKIIFIYKVPGEIKTSRDLEEGGGVGSLS